MSVFSAALAMDALGAITVAFTMTEPAAIVSRISSGKMPLPRYEARFVRKPAVSNVSTVPAHANCKLTTLAYITPGTAGGSVGGIGGDNGGSDGGGGGVAGGEFGGG